MDRESIVIGIKEGLRGFDYWHAYSDDYQIARNAEKQFDEVKRYALDNGFTYEEFLDVFIECRNETLKRD